MSGFAMNADQLDRLRAAIASRYRIVRELGRGGMATVYLADDLKHDRRVALKVLLPALAAAIGPERFLREIKLTAQLNHPHILPLLDSDQAGEFLFYAMPYVEGESLRSRLDRQGRLPLADAAALTREVAAALDYAHHLGIVHRDIKPENILLQAGEAVVADFGIALAVQAAGADTRLTQTGSGIGTPTYMSPEQIEGQPDLDGRTDVYALGCMVYEMLAGQPPFTGPSVQAIMARRVTQPTPLLSGARPEVPEGLDRAIQKALAPDRAERFGKAGELALAVTAAAAPAAESGLLARLRRPRVAIPLALVLVALAAAVVIPLRAGTLRERARDMVGEAERLAEARSYGAAYAAAERAERWLEGDSALARVMTRVSDRLSVTSKPEGARVWLQRFTTDSAPVDSVLAGETPLSGLRVPRLDHRVVLVRDGFEPAERIASSSNQHARELRPTEPGLPIEIDITLQAGIERQGMVEVPGGEYRLVAPGAPVVSAVTLSPYFIERFEVSNAAYRSFVQAGGYTAPQHWEGPLRTAGLEAGATLALLVDRTGLPGPRGWSGQAFPAGLDRHPVTGISWVEAAAYCGSRGRRLPTMFEWEKAGRNGAHTYFEGTSMPWGFLRSGEGTAGRANFQGSGTLPVDAHPFGISWYGAYAMAGNVREWTRNAADNGFVATGGSWEDPAYVFGSFAYFPTLHTAPSLGFRCAATADSSQGGQGGEIRAAPLKTPVYRPSSEAEFRSALSHYRYDRRPPNARMVEAVSGEAWTRERIWIDGVAGDSLLLYLYLPTQAAPPFQTIIYSSSFGSYVATRISEEVEWALAGHIRAGRAVLATTLDGMLEIREGPFRPPEPTTVEFRNWTVRRATEFRLGIDYLATRGDIDMGKLAYLGFSHGAGTALPFAAVDNRFKAVVLAGGGINLNSPARLPEVSAITVAPHIRPPKLVLNGRHDEDMPYLTQALPLWNLLREPKELIVVDGGHLIPPEVRVPAINRFLDRVLGPVRRQR